MNKLKIATFVTSHYKLPLQTERIFAPVQLAIQISQGLEKKGHSVTLFGPKGSKVDGLKVRSYDIPALLEDETILEDKSLSEEEKYRILTYWDQFYISNLLLEAEKGEFDIVHIHPVDRALPFVSSHATVPIIYTLHDPVTHWRKQLYKMFYTKNQHFVSISKFQGDLLSDFTRTTTIYNGIDTEKFTFSPEGGDYLLYAGRIHPHKGVAEAVQLAIKSQTKLLITGQVTDTSYFEDKVKPYLGSQIHHIAFQTPEQLTKHYQNARAFLFPLQWDEPFGLVMTESMACGTPVIAYDRGSVSEVVNNGVTGFVCDPNNSLEILNAIEKIMTMPAHEYQSMRKACRKHVEENFTINSMVDQYETIYKKIKEQS